LSRAARQLADLLRLLVGYADDAGVTFNGWELRSPSFAPLTSLARIAFGEPSWRSAGE
jgi:hypothetical protein